MLVFQENSVCHCHSHAIIMTTTKEKLTVKVLMVLICKTFHPCEWSCLAIEVDRSREAKKDPKTLREGMKIE